MVQDFRIQGLGARGGLGLRFKVWGGGCEGFSGCLHLR